MTKDITPEDLHRFQQDFDQRPDAAVVARAVQKNGVISTSENYAAKRHLDPTFSVEVETGKVANQKKSGRCWLFATLNTLRHKFAEKYKMKDFQFSQNYLSFYDRLEKSNKFYEDVLATADLPLDSREVQFLLKWGNGDGGQWANGPALIEKYGLVPQYVMPETLTSDKTAELNPTLNLKLRKDAITLRNLAADGADAAKLRETKMHFLNEIYRILVDVFGQPPVEFDFEYRDDEHNYHIDRNLTPQSFYQKYVDWNFDDYVCLTDAPDHEQGKLFGLPSQDYIFNGKKIEFLTVDTQALKDATIKQLQAGETAWLGCDVLNKIDRQKGILDPDYFKEDELFGVDLEMSKADRLASGEGTCSHAMTFTGVDLVDGQSTKWKVENSWGEKVGKDGYFIMTDEWFDKYMYEVIINKKYLTEEQRKLLDQQRVDLKPWDSLA